MGQKVIRRDESYALVDGPVARPEAGQKSTPGCKACDEERSAVKRRDRPFNHTPECNEKQADFRARLRKMKMLPLDGTSSMLDPYSSVAWYECDCCIDSSLTWLKQPFFKETASSHQRLVGRHGMGMCECCL